jgi:hypothetical protein
MLGGKAWAELKARAQEAVEKKKRRAYELKDMGFRPVAPKHPASWGSE